MVISFKKIRAFLVGIVAILVSSIGINPLTVAFADGGQERNQFVSKKQKTKSKAKKKKIKSSRKRKSASKTARLKKVAKAVPISRARQLLITFSVNTPSDVIDAVVTKYKFRKIADATNSLINLRIVKVALRRQLSNTLRRKLINETTVIGVQPNFLYTLAAQRSVQYVSKTLNMPAVHKISKGDGVRIAILDSGVFTKHPALKNVIAKSFDAVGKAGRRNTNHGTGIASIIVARGKITGLAPKSRVLSVRVFASDRRGGRLKAETFYLMRGIDWAVKEKPAIINMSFAGPKDVLFQKAIVGASKMGIALVAAVGNQGAKKPVAFPAAYEQVVAVTATGIKNQLYRHANRGGQVSLAAPGVNVLVARRTRSYGFMTGTSAAAAYVSASLAIILQLKPDLKPNQATKSLIDVATDLGTKGHDKKFGHGLLNVYRAIKTSQ